MNCFWLALLLTVAAIATALILLALRIEFPMPVTWLPTFAVVIGLVGVALVVWGVEQILRYRKKDHP